MNDEVIESSEIKKTVISYPAFRAPHSLSFEVRVPTSYFSGRQAKSSDSGVKESDKIDAAQTAIHKSVKGTFLNSVSVLSGRKQEDDASIAFKVEIEPGRSSSAYTNKADNGGDAYTHMIDHLTALLGHSKEERHDVWALAGSTDAYLKIIGSYHADEEQLRSTKLPRTIEGLERTLDTEIKKAIKSAVSPEVKMAK